MFIYWSINPTINAAVIDAKSSRRIVAGSLLSIAPDQSVKKAL